MTNLPPEAERVVREAIEEVERWQRVGGTHDALYEAVKRHIARLRALLPPEPSAGGGLREKLAALANRIQDDLFVTPGEHNVGVEIRRILAETPEADYGPLVEWAIAHRQWLRFNAPSADDALKAAGIE